MPGWTILFALIATGGAFTLASTTQSVVLMTATLLFSLLLLASFRIRSALTPPHPSATKPPSITGTFIPKSVTPSFNRCFSGFGAVVLLLSTGSLTTALAQTAPTLGTAKQFAVLGASTVTNTGPTTVAGDLGVSPGNAVTGFPPGLVTGTIHAVGAVPAQARLDAITAYNSLASQPCTANLTGTDLGGLTLLPGVYCFDTSAQLTGTLTLNGLGSTNPVFIFKIGSTLTTASNSAVIVTGGSPCDVFFQVGSSATLGTTTRFLGNIFALASITLTTGVTVTGGTYALNGAVTMDSNAVTACMGTLQVCKVAGFGVVPGTTFQFSIAGSPATVISVPAGPSPGGSCSAALSVPAQAAVITETLPGGTVLAGVSTQPSAGLLVSSNLVAGTATVTVLPGGATIATFIDTIPTTTGLLQICKVAGNNVSAGTPFTFDVAGTPVVVPAGSCSTPMVAPAGQTLITETLPANTVLTSVTTLPSAGLLVSSNLAAGTATVTINTGVQTIATFTNAVNPTTGSVQICKVAGTGVAAGTNFTFSVGGTPVAVAAGACSTPVVMPAGSASITETLPTGIVLAAVSTLPAGSLVSANLPAGTATVTVNAGATTIATFTNNAVVLTTGFLQVCKVAGANVAAGTPFTINVAGTPVVVQAGPAPGGTCSTPVVVPAGPAIITETLPAGTVLTSVSTLPAGSLVSSNLAGGTATVTVVAGGQTIATFVNTGTPPPSTGFLQVCKIAGANVAAGTNFTFNVAGTPVVVSAGPAPLGTCSTPVALPAGPAVITETLPAGTVLTSVSTLPVGSLVSANLATGTATVTVIAGGQTIATFLNTGSPPPTPTTGFLQVCKIAGAGVAVGTNFTFNVAGTPVVVQAGTAPGGSCSTPMVVPIGDTVITETPSPGTVLTAVSTLPAGSLVSANLPAGTATVTVNAGGQTIVTFLNTIIPTDILRICKIAGSGVAAGANFTFVVAGVSFTVRAGSCVTAGTFPVGTSVTVVEAPSSGTTLSAISVSPPDRLVTVNLAGRTVAAIIGTGGTVVNFTNSAGGLGLLKVCKIAGTGVVRGTYFNFTRGGPNFRVPAGFCVNQGTLPIGTVVTITEVLSPGTAVTAISVLPANRQGTVNLPGRTVTATIGTGVTEVYFTNVRMP